jgi:formylglycine-generating enzyme required for sulfatase activity
MISERCLNIVKVSLEYRSPAAISLVLLLSALLLTGTQKAEDSGSKEYTNSVGLKMIRIQPGSFLMGNDQPIPAEELQAHSLMSQGDYDEQPVRRVAISQPFYLSETEITVEQYRHFRPDAQDTGRFSPFVQGVSWHEAVAFAEWLGQREGRNYRLPTEAEWEYACRAGTTSLFSSGDMPPQPGIPNAWGLRNMHTGVLEWCWDWHGLYPNEDQTDPVGRQSGVARAVRGGGIQVASGASTRYGHPAPYYARSANRAGVPPGYRGQHLIGFRLVEAPLPTTDPLPADVPFVQQAVRQTNDFVKFGPTPGQPYFKRRFLLPIPPENVPAAAVEAAGLHPAVMAHNHSPGLEVTPNGDLLAVFFSSSTSFAEYWPNVRFIATRLRFGSDQWDMPEPLYDFPDVNDQTALLWNDAGVLRLFTGGIGLTGVPFRMCVSTDNGSTWSDIEFPVLVGDIRGFYPQPINSAFRGPDGAIYIPSDAIGGASFLWASRDNGHTWRDTGGRTGGRHTSFALLKDGSILGMGGKNTDIDGYMPKSVSSDWGKTWKVSKTPFAALGSNQRPTLVRLASGRLFFAGDYQHFNGKRPQGMTGRGCYVALSEDEGQTWIVKTLPGTLPHETKVLPALKEPWSSPKHDAGTLGYSVAKQAPNGVIHLVTTMNHPALHFEMNEAWILRKNTDGTLASPSASGNASAGLLISEETHTGGAARARWSGRRHPDGRYLLHGQQTSFHDNGRKQWEVLFDDGRKVGMETLSDRYGRKVWSWEHNDNGTSLWTQFWTNGQKKHESLWRNGRCEGLAKSWDHRGKLTGQFEFKDGMLIGEAGVWNYSGR